MCAYLHTHWFDILNASANVAAQCIVKMDDRNVIFSLNTNNIQTISEDINILEISLVVVCFIDIFKNYMIRCWNFLTPSHFCHVVHRVAVS